MSLTLRRATAADAGGIARLHSLSRAAYYGDLLDHHDATSDREPMWRRLIADPDRITWCAQPTAGAELVGFCCVREPPTGSDEVELNSLYVHPARFGTGIAQTLYGQFVVERRGRAARLEVWDENARAKAFYRRQGWQSTSEQRPGPGGVPFVTWRLSPLLA